MKHLLWGICISALFFSCSKNNHTAGTIYPPGTFIGDPCDPNDTRRLYSFLRDRWYVFGGIVADSRSFSDSISQIIRKDSIFLTVVGSLTGDLKMISCNIRLVVHSDATILNGPLDTCGPVDVGGSCFGDFDFTVYVPGQGYKKMRFGRTEYVIRQDGTLEFTVPYVLNDARKYYTLKLTRK